MRKHHIIVCSRSSVQENALQLLSTLSVILNTNEFSWHLKFCILAAKFKKITLELS